MHAVQSGHHTVLMRLGIDSRKWEPKTVRMAQRRLAVVFVEDIGWKNKLVLGRWIVGNLPFIVKHKNRYLAFDLQGFLLGIVKDQPTAESSLARLSGLVVNGLSPYSSDMISDNRRGARFPRKFLFGFERLTAHQREQHKQAHDGQPRRS